MRNTTQPMYVHENAGWGMNNWGMNNEECDQFLESLDNLDVDALNEEFDESQLGPIPSDVIASWDFSDMLYQSKVCGIPQRPQLLNCKLKNRKTIPDKFLDRESSDFEIQSPDSVLDGVSSGSVLDSGSSGSCSSEESVPVKLNLSVLNPVIRKRPRSKRARPPSLTAWPRESSKFSQNINDSVSQKSSSVKRRKLRKKRKLSQVAVSMEIMHDHVELVKKPSKRAVLSDETTLEQSFTTKKCSHCEITETPQWREGPLGPRTLCNACGVRYRTGRLYPEYRPAASPTFIPSMHSNSHKKVTEMRKKAEQEATVEVLLEARPPLCPDSVPLSEPMFGSVIY